ncbi:MAG: hypothetical protein OXP71_09295 [Candidatus Poribacteria bacterium]|nr:hypothetical protein [Candidatus Poribacteria bacterium]
MSDSKHTKSGALIPWIAMPLTSHFTARFQVANRNEPHAVKLKTLAAK